MHGLFLGTGKDNVASGVLLLCEIGWFPGTTQDEKFNAATNCFRAYWLDKGITVKAPRFTKHTLGLEPFTYPLYEGKAGDMKLALFWLAHEFFFANILNHTLEVTYAASMFWGISDMLWVLDHAPMCWPVFKYLRMYLHAYVQ